MAIPKIIGAQRDFTAGEVDVALKRADDHPARQKGARQFSNMRALNSGIGQNRPGRRALYPITNSCTRTDEVTMSAGATFKIAFGNARLQIIDSTGTVVLESTTTGGGVALPWSTSTLNNVVFVVLGLSIYITFTGMRPQVVTWDGTSTWSIADYNETVTSGGQKRTPFYRISPKDITMLPSATTGSITVDFSSPIVVAGMVGTRARFCGRQLLFGSVVSTTRINATVIEPLPPAQQLTLTGSVGSLNIGDLVEGGTSGAQGIVITSGNTQQLVLSSPLLGMNIGDPVTGGTSGATGFITSINPGSQIIIVTLSTATAFVALENLTTTAGTKQISVAGSTSLVVQLLQVGQQINAFAASEKVAAPSMSASTTAVSTVAPKAVAVWDEEVFNSFRGYPQSVFVDQFRLGFCDYPGVPGGISWSGINTPNDLYAGANPSDPMFELTPQKTRVLYVIPGPEGSEFVFTDKRIYYIPITRTDPLVPGGVVFQIISSDGAGQVLPRAVGEVIFYVNTSLNAVMAIIATGAYLRPYNTRAVSQFHSHLFSSIVALATPTANSTFIERYIYVLNASGAVVVGKYTHRQIESEPAMVGFGPWSGGGTVSWIAANGSDVLFTTSYFGALICEILDDTYYLDAALPVNNLPAAFTPPGGKGPLWWIPSQSVFLMDQTTRPMGTYSIDANGFLIPQFHGGEDLTVSSLVAGQPWTMTFEPFVPDADPGKSLHQRMFRRRVSRMAVYVINSTGFILARLFSGTITPTSPALGTVVNQRRIPAYNQGDDATKPPPLREEAERWRPLGRSFDPRNAVIKDTPGPLQIAEIGLEASI